MVVDLACEVALKTSDRFLLGATVFDSPVDVVASAWIADHAGEDDLPERGVGLTVTTAVEAVTLLFSAACVEGRCATEVREGRLVAETFGVVARCDE